MLMLAAVAVGGVRPHYLVPTDTSGATKYVAATPIDLDQIGLPCAVAYWRRSLSRKTRLGAPIKVSKMQELNKAVSAREGITLALEQDECRVKATIMLSRNNRLSPLFSNRASIAESLRKAERLSLDHGFEGYYDISAPDEWLPDNADLKGALFEIRRQTDALCPRAGAWWGFQGPSLSPRERASIDPIRAQMTRLGRLRDALFRLYPVARDR